jgi:DNA-binding MarR family transcriptional regulator
MDQTAIIERALRRLSRGAHLSRLHARLNAAAEVELDRPAYIALACLAEAGSLTLSALAEASSVEVSTMSRLVDRLVAAGLIEARRSAADQRAMVLSLSDEGARLVERLRAVRREALRALLADWTPEERAVFAQLLSRFVAGIEALASPAAPRRAPGAATAGAGQPARGAEARQ